VRQKTRIQNIVDEAPGIRSFFLEPVDGAQLAPFTPGAHLDVFLDEGLIRSYSLINTTDENRQYHIAVKQELDGRGGSEQMHQLEIGQELEVSEPRNNFPLADPPGRSILVAGGIGITPIYGMAKYLTNLDAPFKLHYLARTASDAAFLETLGAEFGNRFVPALGFDVQAVTSHLEELLSTEAPGTHLYICGPTPLMELGRKIAAEYPAIILHLEYFTADPALDQLPKGAFQIKLAKSGRTITIPEGRSIVEVLAENKLIVETSCEQGICGVCMTKVLGGTPDHRDMLMTDEEHAANNQMTICVSRSIGPLLVLDL
tara:strand:- start:47160 stop:48107 length:948 start_codon:yes stop_codon:yes gene_type:complete